MDKDVEQVNKNKFRNFDETFTQYTTDELDEIIKKVKKLNSNKIKLNF
ncbi:hypothetical protein ACK2FL_04945 [Clostridioides difficile]